MERGRSFSGGWNHKTRSPRIATVKPVSKSFSEADLMNIDAEGANKYNGEYPPTSPSRVFSRLKVLDLGALKKDNLISE